jgi:MOSC domain-containing protein YiiM
MRGVARVLAVNVGKPRTVDWHGRKVRSAIWKAPVEGRLRVEGVLVAGDAQADLRVHGGPTKSVYSYATEDYRWWSEQEGEELGPGTFGDNLTIEGIDPARTVIGERWAIGTAVLRVTEPRIPCFKLGIRMGDAAFVDRFAEAARPGTYLAIEEPGELGAGDEIRRRYTPTHGVTIGDVERAHNADVERARILLDVPDLSADWRAWARKALSRAGRA